jgi:hypothetical protein
MEMWEWFLAFFAGSVVANTLLRILWGKVYFLHKILIEYGYEKGYDIGYWDGCTNIKMYHALMNKKVPPSDWLKDTMGSRLDTRDKMVKVLNEIPR